MRFLIAGFGSIGRRHFRNLKSLGERDIVLYRSGKSQLPTDELEGHIVETSIDAALAHKPDAVIVANPTAMHLDVAIPAARAGCHILLEKPISHSLDRVNELETLAKESGSRVLVGFQFRFHPNLEKMKELVASGEYGELVSARAHLGEYLPGWHPWEDYHIGYSARRDLGGGVVLTICHPYDYMRWLFGEITTVWGAIRQTGHLGIDAEDLAEIGLGFKNGSIGSIYLDYLQRPSAHWLSVICTKALLVWDFATGQLQITGADGQTKQFPAPDGFERNDLFMAQMRHFIDVVANRSQPQCTLTDGRRALEIALAVHRSSHEGRRIELTPAEGPAAIN